MSFAVRALGALSIPALGVPLAATGALAAPVPKPPAKSLPSALDAAPPYQGQRVCDPNAKPGVTAFAQLMVGHYGVGSAAAWNITRACNSGITEHSEGRAWDWMLNAANPQQKAIADSVVAWLSAPDAQGRPGAMARRFGINYIIWNKKMWRAYAPERGWAAYTGSSPHTDHIHFTFTWDGAYRRTSWWTGRAVTTIDPGPKPALPTPTSNPTTPSAVYTLLVQGSTGADVALAQRVIGVPADGQFGPVTLAALKAWQAANRVPVTGKLDAATWARMVALGKVPPRGAAATRPAATPAPASPLARYANTTLRRGSTGAAVVALQKALKITADGQFGPQTDGAVRAFQSRKRLPVTGVVSTVTWKALMGQPTPTTATPSRSSGTPRTPVATKPPSKAVAKPATTTSYTSVKSTVLRQGSSGTAVRVLQRALGGLAVDGAYGPRTAAAVSAFQKAHRLPVTGVTDARVWQALEARDYPLLAYRSTVLKKGSAGGAVVVLQKALGITADGQFGPQTEAAVKALQGRAKIARTGVVASVTWQALEAEVRRR